MALDISLTEGVTLAGAVTSLVLAGFALAQRQRGWLQWSFAFGMVGFAAEALAGLMLLSATDLPEDRLRWLEIGQVAGLGLLVPWAGFVVSLTAYDRAKRRPVLRLALGAGAALVLAASWALVSLPAFQISDIPGPFYAARLDSVGGYAVMVQLLGTVGILAGLELCLRSSRGTDRWRVKYLVLGLGGIFLVRFYFLSQVLLFHVLMGAYLTTGAATLLVGNLVIAASLVRDRLGGVEVALSRRLIYRSVVVGALGLYLVTVGLLGWVLNQVGVAEELFWGSLVIFVSAVGLAALLLSENIKWRIKRVIGRHFYRSKYDYREHWREFTRRLGSLLTLEELAPQLIGAVTEAVGTAQGVLYLADGRDGSCHLAGAVWVAPPPSTLGPDSALVTALRNQRTPLLLGNGGSQVLVASLPAPLGEAFSVGAVAVPLHWRGTLTGLMLLGPERMGARYTAEDLEFLATLGEQVAGAIVTAALSETVAQAREFEAFHRLTSFVIHDLKNSISALSMLSQNALANFDDPEFQRDAIKTLSRTVDRMKALLEKLSSAPEAAPLRFQAVDLAALVGEATLPLKGGPGVSLVKDLGPVPPVSGDPEALLRVIQNLVTNAVEALDGQGSVTVRTLHDQEWVVLSVSDTGCGMAEEFVRRSLFAPFRSTKKGGWGIGLYQAKGIVEGHGGRIEVASTEGEGTSFWVRLPVAAAPPEGAGS